MNPTSQEKQSCSPALDDCFAEVQNSLDYLGGKMSLQVHLVHAIKNMRNLKLQVLTHEQFHKQVSSTQDGISSFLTKLCSAPAPLAAPAHLLTQNCCSSPGALHEGKAALQSGVHFWGWLCSPCSVCKAGVGLGSQLLGWALCSAQEGVCVCCANLLEISSFLPGSI